MSFSISHRWIQPKALSIRLLWAFSFTSFFLEANKLWRDKFAVRANKFPSEKGKIQISPVFYLFLFFFFIYFHFFPFSLSPRFTPHSHPTFWLVLSSLSMFLCFFMSAWAKASGSALQTTVRIRTGFGQLSAGVHRWTRSLDSGRSVSTKENLILLSMVVVDRYVARAFATNAVQRRFMQIY